MQYTKLYIKDMLYNLREMIGTLGGAAWGRITMVRGLPPPHCQEENQDPFQGPLILDQAGFPSGTSHHSVLCFCF